MARALLYCAFMALLGFTLWSVFGYSSVVYSPSSPAPSAEVQVTDARYRELLCGPSCMAIALGRLGVGVPSDILARQCKVTESGVTFEQLQEVARRYGKFRLSIRRITWEELLRVDGVALLLLKRQHYIVADPNEQEVAPGAARCVRVYDVSPPARWWSREVARSEWDGEALLIEREKNISEPSGPSIEWSECFVDKGLIDYAPVLSHNFTYRNNGSAPLTIQQVGASCGCIKQTLSKEVLEPGETGDLNIAISVGTSSKTIKQYVVVETNDMLSPRSVLTLAAACRRQKVVSKDAIDLGETPQGGDAICEFYVAAAGFGEVKAQSVFYVAERPIILPEGLTIRMMHRSIDDDAEKIASTTGFRVDPGDLAVKAHIRVSSDCPIGSFAGHIVVEVTNAGAASVHKILLRGDVVPNVHSVPRVAVLRLDDEGAGEVVISLKGHVECLVSVNNISTSLPDVLRVRAKHAPLSTSESEQVFLIQASEAFGIKQGAPTRHEAYFELSDGTVVTVPIMVVGPQS